MRITAGKHKNQLLLVAVKKSKVPGSPTLRPTTAKTRQAVFNILHHASFLDEDIVSEAAVLDLCCGCGSFGLEALSRGAASVTFVDADPTHLALSRRNAENLKEEQCCKFTLSDVLALPTADRPYNLIYIDPPYAKAEMIVHKALVSLLQGGWLAQKHVIVVETGKRARLQMPAGYQLLAERQYGATTVRFLQNK